MFGFRTSDFGLFLALPMLERDEMKVFAAIILLGFGLLWSGITIAKSTGDHR
jgi:hypothetical protein